MKYWMGHKSLLITALAQNLPVTTYVTQRKGSCQDCQNLASTGLVACFLSQLPLLQPSHSLAALSILRLISTPGTLHCSSFPLLRLLFS